MSTGPGIKSFGFGIATKLCSGFLSCRACFCEFVSAGSLTVKELVFELYFKAPLSGLIPPWAGAVLDEPQDFNGSRPARQGALGKKLDGSKSTPRKIKPFARVLPLSEVVSLYHMVVGFKCIP
jgi:hypothetical protein